MLYTYQLTTAEREELHLEILDTSNNVSTLFSHVSVCEQ